MNLQRRFRISMGIYALVAAAIWTTMSGDKIPIGDRLVSLRVIALLVVGLFAVKTLLFWKAERIRKEREGR